MLDIVTPGADAVLSHAEGDLLAKLIEVYEIGRASCRERV